MAAAATGDRDRAEGNTGGALQRPFTPRKPETARGPQNGGKPEISIFSNSGSTKEQSLVQSSQAGQYQGHLHTTLRSPKQQNESTPVQSVRSCNLSLLSSSVIPVPKHRLDEAIAAAALTSLSSGPSVLGAGTTLEAECNTESCRNFAAVSPSRINSCNLYISTSVCSTRSPPLPPTLSSASLDVGIEDSDTTHFLFGDPVPRKRKNSARLMFRCLWKNCGKVLSTSSAIQKHIRSAHLGRCKEKEHSDGEEDFYYTEMDVNVDTLSDGLSSLTPTSPTSAGPPSFPEMGSLGATQGPELPIISPLSVSAPSTLCHVYTDHPYQAPSPSTISLTSKVSSSWQPPSFLVEASPVCPTSGAGDSRQMLFAAAPNQKQGAGTRKGRGEAKKCRKVYGMERKDLWCTACRWKKACQRFID
ncbi:SLC2A4 regulator isoform X6 [Pelobates cultripes]|uniref:SLC2A4 regulator isoform X6 n=1 Tax=Pelobates cultripes TaxID=61616 RepID=A0AAD1WD09_PELCU|nr:SLC2A4 regulator isoform X6 [Pelobates cultripes]